MKSKPRIYIDSCYFIDVAKGRLSATLDPGRIDHLPYVEGALRASLAGHIEVWTSTITSAECLCIDPAPEVPDSVQDVFRQLFESGNVVRLEAADIFVMDDARDLRWKDGIKCGGGADGIHVATAIKLGCVELWSTNKRRGPLNADAAAKLFLKHQLRVIAAPDTQAVPSQYLPGPLFRVVP